MVSQSSTSSLSASLAGVKSVPSSKPSFVAEGFPGDLGAMKPSSLSVPSSDLPDSGPMAGVVTESGGSSYPCSQEVVTSQEYFSRATPISTRMFRCRCGSVWCPACWRRGGLKKAAGRLRFFDWRKTRQIILTVNPALFASGEEAHDYVKEKRYVANFVWNLKRTADIGVVDWVWFLEWHKNGFPHFHLFIEVEKSGKAGQIGEALIHRYWPVGTWLIESYIHDEMHWNRIVGYFDKHGYFSDEAGGHQGRLPVWALERRVKMRRWGSMMVEGCHDGGTEKFRIGIQRARIVEKKSYQEILDKCGSKTLIEVWTSSTRVLKQVDVPYDEMRKKFQGFDQKGLGYIGWVGYGELKKLLVTDERLIGVWFKFQDMCFEAGNLDAYW